MEPVVTVGLDGSPESLSAAHWAAREARQRRLALRLLHAWVLLPAVTEPAVDAEEQSTWARRVVEDARAEITRSHPDLTVTADLVADETVPALLEASEQAEMLVLGSRGLGPLQSFFVGDIGLEVVARIQRPVVLVRAGERVDGRTSADRGDVVVGLGLRRPCESLFRFAFDAADRRGSVLRAVHARSLPAHAHAPWPAGSGIVEATARQVAEELTEALGPWRRKYPAVRVVEEPVVDSASRAVVRASSGSGLLVVGRCSNRSPLTTRLGPVTHAALHHSGCPVVIVPHD